MKRRLFSSTILAVVAAFALTACGSGDSSRRRRR